MNKKNFVILVIGLILIVCFSLFLIKFKKAVSPFNKISSILSKDFPQNQQDLEQYKKSNKEIELKGYYRVIDGINELFKNGREKALNLTLREIQSSCISIPADEIKQNIDKIEKCTGALYALYYFNLEQEDKKILIFFQTLEVITLEEALDFGPWRYNRSIPKQWINFIEKLSVQDEKKERWKSEFQRNDEITQNYANKLDFLLFTAQQDKK